VDGRAAPRWQHLLDSLVCSQLLANQIQPRGRAILLSESPPRIRRPPTEQLTCNEGARFSGSPSRGARLTLDKTLPPARRQLAADDAAATLAGPWRSYENVNRACAESNPTLGADLPFCMPQAPTRCKGSVMFCARRRTCRRCIWWLVKSAQGRGPPRTVQTPQIRATIPASTDPRKRLPDWLN